MDKAAFTKGPWRVDEEYPADVFAEAVPVATALERRPDDPNLQLAPGLLETIANAHLIAAAPAMYEALKALIALYEEDEGCADLPEIISARAALAAAEGGER